jgi:RNA-binding protein
LPPVTTPTNAAANPTAQIAATILPAATVTVPTDALYVVEGPMLTGKQRRYLRGLGHHRDPVVQIGKDGRTEGVQKAVEAALEQHELIKVRLLETVEEDRHELAAALATDVKADLVQVLGRTLLLYKPREEEPEIKLPKS